MPSKGQDLLTGRRIPHLGRPGGTAGNPFAIKVERHAEHVLIISIQLDRERLRVR